MTPNETRILKRRTQALWGLALLGLCLWTVWRIGGFDLSTTLPTGETVPNTYATVDHPFHASRAAVVLDYLGQGEIVRWMTSHQGGYPVEFYPLGVAWFEVILWLLSFGTWPILSIHKLAVALVFVLPALAYWLLVRGDRVHPSAAFLATAIHIAVPGHWLNGGYEELVGWGLITNVTGATLALLGTVLLARYVLLREHPAGILAVLAIAAGAVSNPRSLFAIALASVAIVLVAAVRPETTPLKRRLLEPIVRVAVAGGLAFLLAAPVVLSLLRYSSEYFFLHYQFYDPLTMYWDALVTAMTRPVLWAAIIGGVALVVLMRRYAVGAALAVTVGLYTLFTIWIATSGTAVSLVEQLEAPRLMPFQRMSMIGLAAVAVVISVRWLVSRLPALWQELVIGGLVIAVSVAGISHMTDPGRNVLPNEVALYEVPTVGEQQFADLDQAITLASDLRPPGSSVFVIGNVQNWWHEQLWAPGIANGTYYYDDWMWYWHSDQPGPYDPRQGYHMQNPSDALTMEYFDQHGIGIVVVSDMWVPAGTPPRETARTSNLLEPAGSFGNWDVYTVREPGSMVSRGDASAETVEVGNGRITARFNEGEGDILVRQNWFHRWQATVNGEPARITRDDSGYMRIEAPIGEVELVLEYGVTAVDWIARAGSVVGVIGLAAFAWRGQRIQQVFRGE